MFEFDRSIIIEKDRDWFTKICDKYSVKYAVAKMVKPKIIAEIGVRAGYSAWAFLKACPSSIYYGFDDCSDENNPEWKLGFNALVHTESMLSDKFQESIVTMKNINTQSVSDLGINDVDLFHVDGDHSYHGCMHDLYLAMWSLSENGVILIDDYDFLQTVKMACDEFASKTGMTMVHIPSARGECVFVK